jgi:hypothetical protein
MFISDYIQKLNLLKQHLFATIDGIESKTLDEVYESHRIDCELREINIVQTECENSFIIITDHAYSRAKERLSMNKTSFRKLSEKAYLEGVTHADTAGNLNKYITKLYKAGGERANNIRIYGEVLFMFKGNILLTTYQVPNNLRKSALKIQKS